MTLKKGENYMIINHAMIINRCKITFLWKRQSFGPSLFAFLSKKNVHSDRVPLIHTAE